VAGNLGLAEPQDFDEKTDANFAVADEIEDAEAGGVGEGAEEGVEREVPLGLWHTSDDITCALTYIKCACSLRTYSHMQI